MTLLDALRDHLTSVNICRKPDTAGVGARPWLPPVWRHPDTGPVAPGDTVEMGRSATAADDGLVVSLMMAPGLPPAPGAEERRQDGVDIVLRSKAVPAAVACDAAIRATLIGTTDPGGRSDWTMGGLYVIQARLWRPFQPVDTAEGVFTFSTGYLFETRVA